MRQPSPRVAAAHLLLTVLLGATACDVDDARNRDDRTADTCKSLLGEAGTAWVKGSSARETGVVDVVDLGSAKARFREDAMSWSGDEDKVSRFSGSEVCRIVVRDQSPHTSALSLRFGASAFPFDSPFGEKNAVYDDETLTPVNEDVRLVTRRSGGSTSYDVYVRCRVPGAPEGQETGVPLQGSLTDTLTGGTAREERQKYLLHAAGVVAKRFDCRNHPVVPDRP